MKTSDEIKKGLVEATSEMFWATKDGDADDMRRVCGMAYTSMADALALIQQLEAERDAAVAGLKSNCTCPECKYFSDDIQDPCRGCKPNDSKFEWRGILKEPEA